ncbi:ssDNA endonuclease and repair protein rad10 [Toensbergia leucococca]|nr:ssDNA endonuclease and repair protein rad10 [Toensbergia leucococca]
MIDRGPTSSLELEFGELHSQSIQRANLTLNHTVFMEDDFGADVDFSAAVEAVERGSGFRGSLTNVNGRGASSNPPKVVQPKPQALPSRAAPSSILVSARQKGNPILNNIRSLPWEYSDIPADYVLGNTTCALFLSLKYHRLHPEYIYSRIRALGGKYNLRVLLTMVDIQNHEESLKELSKTSLINNLTLILCWSAQEAGRYLELYKSYENASPTSIRAHQSTSYSEKLVEFITVPRSINKTDAVGLVSTFGSIRAAVNARPEEIGTIAGWGEKKVQSWCGTVLEDFRVRKAAKRGPGLERANSSRVLTKEDSLFEDDAAGTGETASSEHLATRLVGVVPDTGASGSNNAPNNAPPDSQKRQLKRPAAEVPLWEPGEHEEDALLLAAAEEEDMLLKTNDKAEGLHAVDGTPAASSKANSGELELNEGMMAALAKLRKE